MRGELNSPGAFIYLDITPKGRNEKEIMDWVRRHDEYEDVERSDSHCASELSTNVDSSTPRGAAGYAFG